MLFAPILALAVSNLSDLDAAARAEGNRKPLAIAVGRSVLRTIWPAQVMKIRVDGVGRHDVAGIVVSGVKFHTALDPAAFTAEIVALVQRTFAASDVDEVDIWATVPLPYVPQVAVDGEYLQPTTRIVYAAAVERPELSTFAARLARGDEVYWDPSWRRSLSAGTAPR